jgi:hypothetical protein
VNTIIKRRLWSMKLKRIGVIALLTGRGKKKMIRA